MEEDKAAGKPTGLKAGFKTSEFWLTLGMLVAGVVLVALGKDQLGENLMKWTGTGYVLSRGAAKIGVKS